MKVKSPVTPERPKTEAKSAPAPASKKQFAKALEEQATQPMPMQTAPLERRVDETPAPSAATPAQRLAELASEIGAKIESSPEGEVTITFEAKTFDGLQVQLSREQGQLTVKLVTPTPEIANQLSAGAESLRQRLEERGYRRAVIQVQRTPRGAAGQKEQKPWR